MPSLKLVVPGADFSSTGLGKYYDLPDIRSSLYAAYFFGSDFGTGLNDLTRNGRTATLNGIAGGVAITAVATPGVAYTSAPVVSFSGGGGTGAAATAVYNATSNTLTGINMTASGAGYTSAPTVTLTGGTAGTIATATAIIAKQNAKSLQCGGGLFATTPVIGTTLAAINGGMTFVTISKALPNVGHLQAGTYGSSGATVGFCASLASTINKFQAYAGAGNTVSTPTADTARGSVYEFVASTHAPTQSAIFAKKGAAAERYAASAVGSAVASFGTASAIRFGDAYADGSFNFSAPEIVCGLIYSKVLTQAELLQVYTGMQTILAENGVAI